MDLTVSRRQAEAFDAALTSGHPDGLAREVAVTEALRELGTRTAVEPTAEFRTALRSRLLAVAAVQGIGETATAPTPSPAPAAVSWRRRAATIAAGAMASAVAVTGVSVAASQSLPGDPFYGLKRTAEDVQLRFADTAEEEGARHLQFAATRLRELRELALGRDLAGREGELSDADAERIAALLDDMDAETRAAQRLLTEVFRATSDAAPLERLARFAEQQSEGLRTVLPALPGDTRSRARTSLALVVDLRSTAGELLQLRDCSAACDPASSAPVLPEPGSDPSAVDPCECPAPAPAPSVAPAPTGPAPAPGASGEATPAPAPASPAPAPTSEPTSEPTPGPTLPVPLPTVPLPTPTLPPLPPLPGEDLIEVPPLVGDGGLLDGLTGLSPSLSSGVTTGFAAVSPATHLATRLLGLLRGWW